jgi:hypothetical protein
VNRDAYMDVGAWDTHIPFYASDCDMYLRLHWAGYWQPQSDAGMIFDVSEPLDDVGALFRLPGSHASFPNDPVFLDENRPGAEIERSYEQDVRPWVEKEGETWQHLVQVAMRMQESKLVGRGAWRNMWQTRQMGGQDEPFYRDAFGFEEGIQTMIEAGRNLFADKWGHRGCDLLEMGIVGDDVWKLERDWDINESRGSDGGNWGKNWGGIG